MDTSRALVYTAAAAGGMIIPSYLGRGGSHPLPPRTSHPPGLHTQLLKPVRGHNGQKFGSDGGLRAEGARTLGPASRGSTGGGGRANAPAISGGLGQMFREAPQAQQGWWSYHFIWAVAAPCPYIHNGLKPMHVNTPCLHTQWPKNAGLPGVSGGEVWEPWAGDLRVCRSWRRKCTSNLGGHEPMYVKYHLPGPRGGPPRAWCF